MVEFTLWDIVRNLLLALRWTVALSAIAFIGGGVVGGLLLTLRIGLGRRTQRLISLYVQLFQGTPLLMQLFLAYFGLALLGLEVSAWTAAALALTLYTSAYLVEIWRGCVEAVPRGQWEAAQSLALSPVQVFTRVVLPPALQRVWPAMTSQIIIVMLGSAVCGQISTEELSYAANLIQSRNFRAFEAFIIATLTYLALAMLARRLLMWAGPRFVFGEGRHHG